MDIRKFTAGSIVKHSGHKTFQPESVKHNYTWKNTELNTLLEKACLLVGELNGLSAHPDTRYFTSLCVLKEAIHSCAFDLLELNMEDALLPVKQIAERDKEAWLAVNKYVKALNLAIEGKPARPFPSRLMSQTHKLLLEGAGPGTSGIPGEFRKTWGAVGGDGPEEPRYIPPGWQEIPPLMDDLLQFLEDKELEVPAFIRIAIAHYQFHCIQPFNQANGRMAIIMIPVYLVNSGVLRRPVLGMSAFFLKHEDNYLDVLETVREKDKLGQWLKFFLTGVVESAGVSITRLQALHRLKQETEQEVNKMGKKLGNATRLLDHLWLRPVISASEVVGLTGVSKVSVYKLIDEFISRGILKETRGFQRNRNFAFRSYLQLFR